MDLVIGARDTWQGWLTTVAACTACGHAWVAVLPVDCESRLECPRCHRMAGEAEIE